MHLLFSMFGEFGDFPCKIDNIFKMSDDRIWTQRRSRLSVHCNFWVVKVSDRLAGQRANLKRRNPLNGISGAWICCKIRNMWLIVGQSHIHTEKFKAWSAQSINWFSLQHGGHKALYVTEAGQQEHELCFTSGPYTSYGWYSNQIQVIIFNFIFCP